jgi:hypothetical protein
MQWDTYAVLRCGEVHAQIVRFSYWHPNDGIDSVEVSFDARLHIPDEGVGIATIHSDDTDLLHCVGHVATRAASLVDETRCRHAMGTRIGDIPAPLVGRAGGGNRGTRGGGTLVMTHYVPALIPGQEEQWRALAASEFGGRIELGDDLHRVEVDAAP